MDCCVVLQKYMADELEVGVSKTKEPSIDAGTSGPSFTLYFAPMSSASVRVLLALKIKGVEYEPIVCQFTSNGYMLPNGKPLVDVSPEGRVPVLRVGDRLLTQSGAITEWVEDAFPEPRMMPADAWSRAMVRQVCWIIGADTHPYQNMATIRYAVSNGWMVKHDEMLKHPYRVHFLRREFTALEKLLVEAGHHTYTCADELTLADVFLAPQAGWPPRHNGDRRKAHSTLTAHAHQARTHAYSLGVNTPRHRCAMCWAPGSIFSRSSRLSLRSGMRCSRSMPSVACWSRMEGSYNS